MNDQDFDLKIRSIMENAEEEVPSRVWASVSSELAKKGSAKVVTLAWRRFAYVAAAAAVIAAVVFTGTSITKSNTISTDQDSFMLSENGVAAETPASEADTEAEVSLAEKPFSVIPAQSGRQAMTAFTEPESGDEALSEIIEESAYISEVPEASDVEKMEIIDEVEETPSRVIDPFTQMEEERSARRISYKIGGIMSTNGNASSLGASHFARPDAGSPRSITQISKESTYSVPVSFGLGVKIPIAGKWSLETGANYSLLERTFAGTYKEIEGGMVVKTISGDIRHSIHYIGVPVNFSYDILTGKKTQFYTFFGGEVAKAVVNKYNIPADAAPVIYKEAVGGVQVSAALGIGVNFLITDHLGFYIDPSLRYYFDCNQPVSIRTQQQLMMSMELGFRFGF